MVKINPSKLNRMIAEDAYYRAEKRNFAPGYELQDWLEAEQAIASSLKSAKTLVATGHPIQAPAPSAARRKSLQTAGTAKASGRCAVPAVDPS